MNDRGLVKEPGFYCWRSITRYCIWSVDIYKKLEGNKFLNEELVDIQSAVYGVMCPSSNVDMIRLPGSLMLMESSLLGMFAIISGIGVFILICSRGPWHLPRRHFSTWLAGLDRLSAKERQVTTGGIKTSSTSKFFRSMRVFSFIKKQTHQWKFPIMVLYPYNAYLNSSASK